MLGYLRQVRPESLDHHQFLRKHVLRQPLHQVDRDSLRATTQEIFNKRRNYNLGHKVSLSKRVSHRVYGGTVAAGVAPPRYR